MTSGFYYVNIILRKRKLVKIKEVKKLFDKNKLKAKIVEKGYTLEQIAQILGINPATVYRKMAMESDFTRNEIALLKESLNLTIEDINAIFFA